MEFLTAPPLLFPNRPILRIDYPLISLDLYLYCLLKLKKGSGRVAKIIYHNSLLILFRFSFAFRPQHIAIKAANGPRELLSVLLIKLKIILDLQIILWIKLVIKKI